jgi:hypothetical protein
LMCGGDSHFLSVVSLGVCLPHVNADATICAVGQSVVLERTFRRRPESHSPIFRLQLKRVSLRFKQL